MLLYNLPVQNKSMKVDFLIKAQRSASCDGSHNVYKWPNFWSMLMNSSSCWFLGICALLIRRFRLFSAFFYRTDSISSEQLRSQIICYLWVISLAKLFSIRRKYEIYIWYTGTFLWSSNSDLQNSDLKQCAFVDFRQRFWSTCLTWKRLKLNNLRTYYFKVI